MLKEHVETAEKAGVSIEEIRSLGGAARSGIWNQIKSDTLSKKIITMANSETTCLGACILAGKGIGIFDSIDDTGRKFAKPAKVYLPDISVKQTYERAFGAYKKLNASLESLYTEY
jgi:xylulokinase